MSTKQSRLLENLLAIAAFDAAKKNHTTHLLDRLFLLMLGQENCHAMGLLRGRLKDWELYQIKLRVEREIDRTADDASLLERDTFYRELVLGLDELAGIWAGVHGSIDPAIVPAGARPNTGHLLLFILASDSIARRILEMYHVMADEISRELTKLPAEEFFVSEIRIVRRREPRPEDEDWEPSPEEPAPHIAKGGTNNRHSKEKESMLEKYGTDLTRAAAEGKIDPVVGRAREIERMLQILGRRKKNNPVLVGEAGVGKSAIVEGLALQIVAPGAPARLAGKRIFSLDMASLVAGTKFRGEFEERIKALMEEIAGRRNVIVFIDEMHTIVGAGSTQGSLDVANILKPALARGDVQCIGATTLDEYRENIEKDAALERRFQKIVVEPSSCEETLEILCNIKGYYERHHSVVYTDRALAACVELTERYIVDRHFPDKAIDVLDEAGSKYGDALGEKSNGEEGSRPPVEITAAHIEEIITTMTGIPVEKLSQSEGLRLGCLEQHLSQVVVGQSEAAKKVSRSIVRSRSGLKDPGKPIGVFLFVGPTGVGKTLLAKELSKQLFDRPESLIRIDMSEYSEKHNVSRLIGSPPGYVGYGEGGQLTEAVRRQPYSVVLLDEVEKAHPDVFNVMLQMLDDGHLTDGLGRRVDFRNTIIIMTSNVGSRAIAQKAPAVGYATAATMQRETASREAEYRNALTHTFAPEFINRIDDIVVFNSLEAEDIARVVELELGYLIARAAKLGYTLDVSEAARRELAVLGYEPDYGVRSLKRAISERIEEPLALMIIEGSIKPGDTADIGCSGEAIKIYLRV